jgi:hypothetical protein
MPSICLAHPIHFGLIIVRVFGEEYKPCNFIQPTVASSLLGPNILLSALLTNTPNWCSSHNVRPGFTPTENDRYTTTIVLYILMIRLLDNRQKYKRLLNIWWEAFPEFSLFLTFLLSAISVCGCPQTLP